MRMWRAQHDAIGLSRQIPNVAIATPPGKEAQILLTAYRVSNPCLHDD